MVGLFLVRAVAGLSVSPGWRWFGSAVCRGLPLSRRLRTAHYRKRLADVRLHGGMCCVGLLRGLPARAPRLRVQPFKECRVVRSLNAREFLTTGRGWWL